MDTWLKYWGPGLGANVIHGTNPQRVTYVRTRHREQGLPAVTMVTVGSMPDVGLYLGDGREHALCHNEQTLLLGVPILASSWLLDKARVLIVT